MVEPDGYPPSFITSTALLAAFFYYRNNAWGVVTRTNRWHKPVTFRHL